jgi:hypothetical protein
VQAHRLQSIPGEFGFKRSAIQSPVQVPEGFPGYVLTVQRLTTGQRYVKLHDDYAEDASHHEYIFFDVGQIERKTDTGNCCN